jgi:RimJ/RimL family protein N-acetyltransferase
MAPPAIDETRSPGGERTLLPDVIDAARLVLRPWRFADVDDVLAYASVDEWARYLPVPQPYERADAVEFLARQVLLDRSVHSTWAIAVSDRVAGGINIRFDWANRVGEMGWSIARPLWGRGFATEAARAVLATAFGTHLDLNRVRATADVRNVASRRVMEKLGMRHEGTLRQNRITRGEAIDEVWFGILRSEWDADRSLG